MLLTTLSKEVDLSYDPLISDVNVVDQISGIYDMDLTANPNLNPNHDLTVFDENDERSSVVSSGEDGEDSDGDSVCFEGSEVSTRSSFIS